MSDPATKLFFVVMGVLIVMACIRGGYIWLIAKYPPQPRYPSIY
jgi:hypothetical protein